MTLFSRTTGALLVLGLASFSPAGLAEVTFSVSKISEDTNIRSDQRPIPIGFHDDAAQKTFVTWMGSQSHPVVKELDHRTDTWSLDKVVGSSPFVDKHNYPGMLRGPDGRIYLFYGCHNSTLKMAVSPRPGSIDGTWEDRFIEPAERASYPAPIVTADGAFYVFYRDTRRTDDHSDDRPYQFVKSTDGGRTWKRQMAVDPYPRSTDNMCEIYNGKVTYQPPIGDRKARIHLAWTIAGEKLGKHAHATFGRNVYYAYLDPLNDRLYNIEGRDLGTHIDNEESDRHCLVLDTGIPERSHLAGLQVSVHYRDDGRPLIHFDHRLAGGISSATWDGSAWAFTLIEKSGGDPRELEKLGPDSFRVYRTARDRIKTFRTDDGGATWRPETVFLVGHAVDRCLAITDAHPAAKLLITEAGDGSMQVAKRDVFIARMTSAADASAPASR